MKQLRLAVVESSKPELQPRERHYIILTVGIALNQYS